jgi:hypothetical protein
MAAKKERPAPAKAPRNRTTKSQALGTSARAEVSAEEVRKLIAEAAYYRAKKRGFTPGHEVEDWVQAEAEVLRRIGADHSKHTR